MKREALILALLLCQPAYAQNNVEDIGVKTGGYSTEEPQLKPALPEPVKKDPVMVPALETNKKEVAATPVVFEKADAGAKPGNATWKGVAKGTWNRTKRVGRGLQLWKAQTYKDNWNDFWEFAENNKGKSQFTANASTIIWQAANYGLAK